MEFFFYGSLMSKKTLSVVLQCDLETVMLKFSKASLKGYRRFKVKGALYPGIVQGNKEEHVEGILFKFKEDASVEITRRLDRFEGYQYQRITADVVRADGQVVEANVYVFTDSALITDQEWDFQEFLAREDQFLRGESI
ncbi:hypothetical protein MP638_000385 [Amoeboaphelidium occidentale]|nr:hypothetical protein MP638_000385 [Amoeboaphelidium occidentale]